MTKKIYENKNKYNINFSNEEIRNLLKIILERTNSSTLYELVERENFRNFLKDINNTYVDYDNKEIIIKNNNLLYYIKTNEDVVKIKEGLINTSSEYSFTPRAFIEVREKEKQNYNSIITEIISEAKHFNENAEREYSKYVVKIKVKDVDENKIKIQETFYHSEKLDKTIDYERKEFVKIYK